VSNDVGHTSNISFEKFVLENLYEQRATLRCSPPKENIPTRQGNMSREQQYKQLADDLFRRASEEANVQLKAQWEILGARYLEISRQSGGAGDQELAAGPVQSELLKDI